MAYWRLVGRNKTKASKSSAERFDLSCSIGSGATLAQVGASSLEKCALSRGCKEVGTITAGANHGINTFAGETAKGCTFGRKSTHITSHSV